jgi:hypothetical protein
MTDIWTHGVWRVKPGHEDEFVRWWTGLVPTGLDIGGKAPVLLRDRDQPNVFCSFGAWPDLVMIGRFRAEIAPRLAEVRELLEDIQITSQDEVYPGE